jgi:hypothetical protein
MSPWGKYPVYKDIARFEYGRLLWRNSPLRGNDLSRAGTIRSIPATNDFSMTKYSLRKHSVRNPARKSWMKDFENETSTFGPL